MNRRLGLPKFGSVCALALLVLMASMPGWSRIAEDQAIIDSLQAEINTIKASCAGNPDYFVENDKRQALLEKAFSLHEPDDVMDWVMAIVWSDGHAGAESGEVFQRLRALYEPWAKSQADPGLKYHAWMRLVRADRRMIGVECLAHGLFSDFGELVKAAAVSPVGRISALKFAGLCRMDTPEITSYFSVEKHDMNGDGEPDILYLPNRGDCKDVIHILLREHGELLLVDVPGRLDLLLDRGKPGGKALLISHWGCHSGGTVSSIRLVGLAHGNIVELWKGMCIDCETGLAPIESRKGKLFRVTSKPHCGKEPGQSRTLRWDGSTITVMEDRTVGGK